MPTAFILHQTRHLYARLILSLSNFYKYTYIFNYFIVYFHCVLTFLHGLLCCCKRVMETSLQNILQQYPRLFPEKETNSIRERGQRNITMLHSYITVCINHFLWKANSYQSTTKNHLTQFNFLIITNDRLPFLSSFLN